MGTLQENQSLNAEYERNKKEREMQENLEYLNYCNEQLEKTNKNLNYKVEKLEEDYLEMKDNFRVANDEIERLNNIIKEAIEFIYENAYDEKRKYCIDDLWDEIPKLLEILNKGE